MAKQAADDNYSDEEAERRARAALKRALTTPYKTQREMIGKPSRPSPQMLQVLWFTMLIGAAHPALEELGSIASSRTAR
jgi:hypothetical protein